MTDYRYVGRHPGDLADGRPLEPGETVTLDEDAAAVAHNARLIKEGVLLKVPEPRTTTRKEGDR